MYFNENRGRKRNLSQESRPSTSSGIGSSSLSSNNSYKRNSNFVNKLHNPFKNLEIFRDLENGLAKVSSYDKKKEYKKIDLVANYIQVHKTANFTTTCYHVNIDPETFDSKLRTRLMTQNRKTLGVFVYDNSSQIYLLKNLPDKTTILNCQINATDYKITLKFTRKIEWTDGAFLQILNLVIRNADRNLNFKLIKRNYYDPEAMVIFYF